MSYKYKVGDVVRVRDWEDMAQEFKVGPWGLSTDFHPATFDSMNFAYDMRKFCGGTFKITEVHQRGVFRLANIDSWWFASCMVRLVTSAPEEKPTCDQSARIKALEAEVERLKKQTEPKGKTIKQWLETLPDGYRELALKRMRPTNADLVQPTLGMAIAVMAAWSETPEGHAWWWQVENWANGKGFLPKLPKKDLKPILPRVLHSHAGKHMHVVADTEQGLANNGGLKAEAHSILNWHHWSGGECPVNPETLVVVRLRDYTVNGDRASFYEWLHKENRPGKDIIAYAVIEAPKLEG